MTDKELRRDFALMRKFVYTVSDCDGDTDFPEAVRRAITQWEKTQDRLAELEAVVDTDLDALDYEQMTKKDKVRLIQQHLVEEADGTANGKAAMKYNDVKWLFNGQPSPGHCYDLMALAGDESGFDYEEFGGDRTNRITVNLGRVNNVAAFHAANKAAGGDPR